MAQLFATEIYTTIWTLPLNGVDVRLKELIRSIADENKFEVIEMEIMPDL